MPREFLEVVNDWNGFSPAKSARFTESDIQRGMDLIDNAAGYSWRKHAAIMEEVITTTDFPNLFGVILDREMIARYGVAPQDWNQYIKTSTVTNFNTHERNRVDGMTNTLEEVTEKGEYLVGPVQNTQYTLAVLKKGRQFDISWESLINDGMGAFSDVAQRFADAATNTESLETAGLFSSAAGPNVLLYGAPIVDGGQAVTNLGTLALTIANLETTMELMRAQTDPLGNPIAVKGMHLVVPPALEFTARQILTSANKMWVESAGGGAVALPTNNVISQVGIRLHVNDWLPVVDASGNVNTTWYLFADTRQGWAAEYAHLRGHEQPEVVMKASDKVSVSGAPMSPFSGDFATDNVFYRVRIVTGGTQLDPRMTYSQNGTT